MFSLGILSKLLNRLLRDRSVPVGRWAGVRLELHPGSVFVAVALTVSLARAFGSRVALDFGPFAGSPPVVGAGVIVLAAVASVFLHEMAHAWVGRRRGLVPRRVVVHPLGGTTEFAHEYESQVGAEPRRAEPPDAVTEYRVAVAGPVASLLLAVGYAVLFFRIASEPPSSWALLASSLLAFLNFGYGLITLLPAYPLDGGRALRALLWRVSGDRGRATRMAAGSARTFAVAAVLAGVVTAVMGHRIGWLLVLVGVYVGERSQAAGGSDHVTTAQTKSTTMAEMLASTPNDPPVHSDRLDDVASRAGSS